LKEILEYYSELKVHYGMQSLNMGEIAEGLDDGDWK